MNIIDKPEWLDELCPHCGARLVSKHDRFVHLSQKLCRGGLDGKSSFDIEELAEGTKEPAPSLKD